MSVAQKLVAWLDAMPESWIDAQEGLGEIYAEAQVEAAEPALALDASPAGWSPKPCPVCGQMVCNH